MKLVKFTTKHSVYNAGEVAGFTDAHADKLVEAGAAIHEPQIAAGPVVESAAVLPEDEIPEDPLEEEQAVLPEDETGTVNKSRRGGRRGK